MRREASTSRGLEIRAAEEKELQPACGQRQREHWVWGSPMQASSLSRLGELFEELMLGANSNATAMLGEFPRCKPRHESGGQLLEALAKLKDLVYLLTHPEKNHLQ